MTPALSSVFNHLWQSTLFAAAAWLLTLALRGNHARARHALWLAGSLKFLIPFSALVNLGSHLGWRTASAETPQFPYFVQQIGEPMAAAPARVATALAAPAPDSFALPVALVALWAVGFLTVAALWCVRWRRIRAVVQEASPLDLPPLDLQLAAPIRVRSSAAPVEPGVFGIFRPVLLLPDGILERLSAEQVRSLVAHELCHVERRDNLAAAIHSLVEAVFWFHPLLWWMGARMVEERERACDEEVLLRGAEPRAYAEGILTVCEFYLASPAECVAGVSGADLKSRIERIMARRVGRNLGLGRKLLLAAAAFAAIAVPVGIGILNAPAGRAQSQADASNLEFEVASIKPAAPMSGGRVMFGTRGGPGTDDPGQMTFHNQSLKDLIMDAYGVKGYQVSGPSWLESDRFDVVAKVPKGATMDQARLMLRTLLAQRFGLKLHHSTKEQQPIYQLVVAKGGPKLKESADQPDAPMPSGAEPPLPPPPPSGTGYNLQTRGTKGGEGGFPPRVPGRLMMMIAATPNGMSMHLAGNGITISQLIDGLERQIDIPIVDGTGLSGKYAAEQALAAHSGRLVVDGTGLSGKFDIDLSFAPDMAQMQAKMSVLGGGTMPPPPGRGGAGPETAAPDAQTLPTLFTALQEQLGLKLESKKGPVDLLVIDSVEKTPTEN